MKKFLCMILLLCASCLLLSCNAQSPSTTHTNASASTESESQEPPKKEVELFGTTFKMGESWLIVHNNENDASIYFQESKPDPVYDAVSISLIPNVLRGGASWDFANQYMDLLETKMAPQFFSGEYEVKKYDKDKTPGLFMKGKDNEFDKICYLFMNNLTDCIMIMYYHNDKGIDYSSSVQEMVDSMELSFDGFTVEKTDNNSNIDMSNNSNDNKSSSGKTRTCPQCNGSGVIKYYYGASDLEAYLDGHEPYTMDTCPTCHGTGEYSGK